MSGFEDYVRKVVPYTPGEQPKMSNLIKLNTNECPYPPAPEVEKALKEMDYNKLRLYPAPGCDSLVECLADYYKVKKEQVFVGVGSDDVLSVAFLTFFNSDKPILFPDITYSFYDVWADVYKIPYKTIPLTDAFEINPEDYREENGGIVFPNPNAPTGVEMSLDNIEKILKANPESVVIVDEAYIDFGATSALSLLPKYENLLIVQTFSKSRAMAGLRVGYAIGSEKLIKYMNDVKFSINSYTMNMPSLVVGPLAVQNDAYFREITGKIINTREKLKLELKSLGFSFADSKANFIFAKHASVPAKELQEYLRSKNIIVRYFNKPRIDNYLRITIGTDAECDALVNALETYLQGK